MYLGFWDFFFSKQLQLEITLRVIQNNKTTGHKTRRNELKTKVDHLDLDLIMIIFCGLINHPRHIIHHLVILYIVDTKICIQTALNVMVSVANEHGVFFSPLCLCVCRREAVHL